MTSDVLGACGSGDRDDPVAGRPPAGWHERKAFQRTRLHSAGVARLVADVVPGGTARNRGRLPGGHETAANAIELTDTAGAIVRMVLKRRPDPTLDGTNEWDALHAAAQANVPTPLPIAFDPAGRWFGSPALLMSWLPGRAQLDVSGDPGALRQMARALAAVHDCAATTLPHARPRWERGRPSDPSAFERRVWSAIDDLMPNAGEPSALVHLDFHPANTLWQRGRLTGIIDWENGAYGWPGEDLAKCRAYLAITHGPPIAAGLRAAYEAEIGGPTPCLALCDMAYAIGLRRQADTRTFALRQAGFPSLTVNHLRNA
ncbi:MAG: aminoglycoside phosphotransferase family protein, partial [Actinobacteria bacterium]|nr:aminoglycoside phosphotransferase family protein [Actinomycetota bacterium]